jgi:hypothetical protein
MNSSLQISEDELSKGTHRYLHLGREASVQLPFDFGFSSETSDNEDDPPRDILLEQENEEEGESKECHFVTYLPKKPTLSLLTTLPEATRNQLSVWENGEGYWEEPELSASTPTATLDRMLGWQEEEGTLTPTHTSGAQSGKEGLQILLEGEETTTWDRRMSKAVETPKSVRSLFDEQGFYQGP